MSKILFINPKFGLNETCMTILENIFKKYSLVNEVILYGSRAKGNYHDRSDVEMVICNSKIDRQILGNIILDINNSNFPYTIDISIFEKLENKNLIEHINEVGEILYKKK